MEKRFERLYGRYKPEECDLFVEFYPLEYFSVIRKMRLRVFVASNCYDPKTFILEVDLKDKAYINYDFHPRIVNLFLWDNFYQLEFFEPKIYDPNDIMITKDYQNMKIKGI